MKNPFPRRLELKRKNRFGPGPAFNRVLRKVVCVPLALLLMLSASAFKPYDQTQLVVLQGRVTAADRTHESITREALSELYKEFYSISTLTPELETAVQQVVDANAFVDLHFDTPQFHFDNQSIALGRQRLLDLRSEIIQLLKSTDDSVVESVAVAPGSATVVRVPTSVAARERLGAAFHTLQDFYSHSSWVEMGKTSFNADIVSEDSAALGNLEHLFAPANVATCAECFVSNFQTYLQCCPDNSVASFLTTGYFEWASSLLGSLQKPVLRCSHGGPKDVTRREFPFIGINKDTEDCDESPHAALHSAAADLAVQATKDYVRRIRDRVTAKELTPSQFNALLGLQDRIEMKVLSASGNLNYSLPATIVLSQFLPFNNSFFASEKGAPVFSHQPLVEGATFYLSQNVAGVPKPNDSSMPQPSGPGGSTFLAIKNNPDGSQKIWIEASMKATKFVPGISFPPTCIYTDFGPLCVPGPPDVAPSIQEWEYQVRYYSGDPSKKEQPSMQIGYSLGDPGNFIGETVVGFLVDYHLFGFTAAPYNRESSPKTSQTPSATPIASTRPTVTLLSSTTTLEAEPKVFTVPVDSTVQELSFSVTGVTNFTLLAPGGQQENVADPGVTCFTGADSATCRISQPTAGRWALRVSGTGTVQVVVSGRSDLDLKEFRFVQLAGRPGHEGFYPLAGEPIAQQTNQVLATMRGKPQTANFEFRSLAGAPMAAVPLSRSAESDGDLFGGNVVPPSGSFLVYVTGLDSTGVEYQRLQSGPHTAQMAVVIPPPPLEVAAGVSTNLAFQVINLGPSDTFAFTLSDSLSYVTNPPPAIEIRSGETNLINVLLTVPTNAPAGTADSVMLRAQSTNLSALAGNYAVSRVYVVPPVLAASVSLAVNRTADGLTISWANGGSLEILDHIGGTWTALTNVSSPYVINSLGKQKFYRVRQ